METPQIQAKPQALAGVQVLELGSLIAGPYAAALLAQFGAEVIKIEPPASDDSPGGDPLRTWRKLHDGTSLWWLLAKPQQEVGDAGPEDHRGARHRAQAGRHDRHRDRELPPRHALDHVLGVLDAAAVPAGRIYTAADIAADPHYAALGEHTERVLASIGIDRAGYERLRDRGIV